jgi:putative PIN family toxin of toxin-antitoxin system
MKAVLDTVVFVRALINPKGGWGRLLFRFSDRYTIVLSPELIKEILDVLYRSSLRERFPQINEVSIDHVLQLFEQAEVVEPGERLEVCRDPDDNKLFECAVAGGADYIVSEDLDVLHVGEFRGIRTASAGEFIGLLSDH